MFLFQNIIVILVQKMLMQIEKIIEVSVERTSVLCDTPAPFSRYYSQYFQSTEKHLSIICFASDSGSKDNLLFLGQIR